MEPTEFSNLSDAEIVSLIEELNDTTRSQSEENLDVSAISQRYQGLAVEVNRRASAVGDKGVSRKKWLQSAALGEGTSSLQQYVTSEKLEAPLILRFLKTSGVIPAETQTLADVQNPGSVVQWLNQNNITNKRRPDAKQVPLAFYLRDRVANGQIIPFNQGEGFCAGG